MESIFINFLKIIDNNNTILIISRIFFLIKFFDFLIFHIGLLNLLYNVGIIILFLRQPFVNKHNELNYGYNCECY